MIGIMKIGIVGTRGIPAQYGGFEVLAENLAKNFSRDNHEVFVTGFSTNENKIEFENNGLISRVSVTTNCNPRLQNFIGTRKACRVLNKQVKLDAVIVLNEVNFFEARSYRKFGVLTVLHLDGAEARRSGLPIIGKWAHSLFRKLAIESQIPLIVDSVAIANDPNLRTRKTNVIAYAPHFDEAIKPEFDMIDLQPKSFFVAIARFVSENQILELIEGYIASSLDLKLLIIGLGTGSSKYEDQVLSAAQKNMNIHILPKNYNRSEINWLLQNSKGYIHGHSVGGTNPILVDARLHAQLILSHDNSYNRENSGYKEHFWSNNDQLSELLKSNDSLKVSGNASNYQLDSWETIALKYLDLLTKRD